MKLPWNRRPRLRDSVQHRGSIRRCPVQEASRRKLQRRRNAAPVQELTAQVREQGGRYGHRMPRRMRRKMRGAAVAGVDPRFEQERRGEPGWVLQLELPPETRFKTRTISRRGKAGTRPHAIHQRTAEGRPGDHRPDRQGAAWPKGRANHVAHRLARQVCRLYADSGAYRRFPQDRERRGTPAPEAHSANPSRRRSRRIHRPDGGGRQERRRYRRLT